jgi:hypothetical protein
VGCVRRQVVRSRDSGGKSNDALRHLGCHVRMNAAAVVSNRGDVIIEAFAPSAGDRSRDGVHGPGLYAAVAARPGGSAPRGAPAGYCCRDSRRRTSGEDSSRPAADVSLRPVPAVRIETGRVVEAKHRHATIASCVWTLRTGRGTVACGRATVASCLARNSELYPQVAHFPRNMAFAGSDAPRVI